MTERRGCRKHEEGQVLPALLVLVLALLVGGMALFQVGRASTMRAQAQTAADAAALAGARELEQTLIASLVAMGPRPAQDMGPELLAGIPDPGAALARRVEAAEHDYASRNGTRLIAAERPGPLEAWVEVETDDALDRTGQLPVAEGRRARAQARARVVVTFAALPPASSPSQVDPLDRIRFEVRLASGP